MAKFLDEDREELLMWLGYTQPYDRLLNDWVRDSEYTTPIYDRVLEIFQQLRNIDKQLFEFLPDSMAKKVGELELNWIQHEKQLKGAANRLLIELGRLTGVEINYNKYGHGGNVTVNYW